MNIELNEANGKDMNLETTYPVVMDNDLVMGRQAMGLNEAKLLRLAIMQIVKEDIDFLEYKIKVSDMAELFGIASSNIYRDVRDICENLMKEVIYIGDHRKPKKKWTMFNWVSYCRYDGAGTIYIKLHEELKPYLLGLKEWYTTYPCESALAMKSMYAIRVYEVIMAKKMVATIPAKGMKVEISVEELRKACACEDKYLKTSDFRRRVLDIAVNEITKRTECNVTYDIGSKEGRTIVSYVFDVHNKFNKLRTGEKLDDNDLLYLEKKMNQMREKNENRL